MLAMIKYDKFYKRGLKSENLKWEHLCGSPENDGEFALEV